MGLLFVGWVRRIFAFVLTGLCVWLSGRDEL